MRHIASACAARSRSVGASSRARSIRPASDALHSPRASLCSWLNVASVHRHAGGFYPLGPLLDLVGHQGAELRRRVGLDLGAEPVEAAAQLGAEVKTDRSEEHPSE